MTPVAVNASLQSSDLIRSLGILGMHVPASGGYDVAQTLSQYINFLDAASLLQPTQQGGTLTAVAPNETPARVGPAIRKEFDRLRAAAEFNITQAGAIGQLGARLSLPVTHSQTSLDDAGSFAPYRKYHQAHQQNMELKVRATRAKVREMVAKTSARLARLVALDVAFERILTELEASRLNQVTVHLERRFITLRDAHKRSIAGSPTADHVNLWLAPTGWLTRFHQDLQVILCHELDLRLQPSLGLIEAYEAETKVQT